MAKTVDRLVIWRLVPSKPFSDSRDGAWVMLLNVLHIVDLRCLRIVSIDSNKFPIKFSVIYHTEDSKRLHCSDGPHFKRSRANLHDIKRIVVTESTSDVIVSLDVWIFPSLRQAAIVPEDRAMVVTNLPLLHVLFDRVKICLCIDFHLCLGHLGNLGNHVVKSIPSFQRNVVPGGNGLICFREVHFELLCSKLSLRFAHDGCDNSLS
mmetsp:Transcript_11286/g.13423  ORF Transcript_11286/g.13423 Transcript_11286/m.13423 type:complete len:207 (+) Transcript_11286:153-773(+)